MSADQNVECPKCHHKFALTETMSKKIREELESEFAGKEEQLVSKLKEQTNDFRIQFETKLKNEKEKIKLDTLIIAREEGQAQLDALTERLNSQAVKLKDAQAKELELRKAQQEVEDSKRDLELTLTRKLDEERVKIKEEASARVADEYSLKQSEWEKQRSDMAKQIDDLRRKAEQGSQQTQGEVLELEVEGTLREMFMHDEITPVAKGVRGGDIQQKIQTQGGAYAGSILWELKRTKVWSDGWIQKVKDDQREAKADIAVIITSALPKGTKHIGLVDGVWVVDFQSYIGVASILRAGLFDVAKAKSSADGRKDKSSAVYDYINGNEFRGHVEQIVEAFIEMQEDLNAEKRAIERVWAKREKQTQRAISGLSGMYGDLQGRVGKTLIEIPQLALEVK